MESYYQSQRPAGMSDNFEMPWNGFPDWQLHDCYNVVFSLVYNTTFDGRKAYRWAWYARDYRIYDYMYDNSRWNFFLGVCEDHCRWAEPEDIVSFKGFGEPSYMWWKVQARKKWREIQEESSDDEDLKNKSFGESSSDEKKSK